LELEIVEDLVPDLELAVLRDIDVESGARGDAERSAPVSAAVNN
jgi:hypothetical protein